MQITRQADYALRAMVYLSKLEPTQRAATSQIAETKKSRRGRTPRRVLNHVGLLFDGPPGMAGLPFI